MTTASDASTHEIVFSFDTTGSMSSLLVEVRGRISDLIQRLQADIPGMRIAVFAHGDYCDEASSYVTKHIDFTTNMAELCEFVTDVGPTGGGDTPECYELVLREVREKLAWSEGSRRALVMVGDAYPHSAHGADNKSGIDWRVEVEQLRKQGIAVYGIQCHRGSVDTESSKFFSELSERTLGKHLQLTEFGNLFSQMMAICYREHAPDLLTVYEKEVRCDNHKTGLSKDLEEMFGLFRGDSMTDVTSSDVTTPKRGRKRKLPSPSAASSKRKSPPSDVTTIDRPTSSVSVRESKRGTHAKISMTDDVTSSTGAASVKTPENIKTKRSITTGKKPRTRSGFTMTLRKRHVKPVPVNKANPVRRHQTTQPHTHRESVPCTTFNTDSAVTWSRWHKLTSPVSNGDHWHTRRNGGYTNTHVFNGSLRLPFIYEIAVQPGQGKKKYVTWLCFRRDAGNKQLERCLFTTQRQRSNIDCVSRTCVVYVRRAHVANISKMAKLLKNYSYAWWTRRYVVKNDVVISPRY